MWRRHRQPVGICCLITFLLKLHLPLSLGHVPTVHTVLVGNLGVNLLIVLGIPYHNILVCVAIHVLDLFLVITCSGHTLQTVALQTLIYKARGVMHTFHIGVIGLVLTTFLVRVITAVIAWHLIALQCADLLGQSAHGLLELTFIDLRRHHVCTNKTHRHQYARQGSTFCLHSVINAVSGRRYSHNISHYLRNIIQSNPYTYCLNCIPQIIGSIRVGRTLGGN